MAEVNRSPAFWRSFPIFEEFDGETLCELADIASYRKWSAGTVIFQRGDHAHPCERSQSREGARDAPRLTGAFIFATIVIVMRTERS